MMQQHGLTRSAAEELVREAMTTARKRKQVSEREAKRRSTDYLTFLNDASPELDWSTNFARYLASVVDRIVSGEILQAVISLPPRSGKSELITKRLPVYWLESNKNDKIIIGAYNHTLARSFTSAALKIFKERNPSDLDMQAEDEWANVFGGSVRAVGVGSGVTGHGGSLILIDDPTKSIAEAFSKAYRNRVWDWYVNDLRTRRNNIAKTPTIVIATRWHCLITGSEIITSGGVKKIEDIDAGQSVLTSNGFQSVAKKKTDYYSGKVYSIRAFGYPYPLTVTPEHKILTLDGWIEARNLTIGQSVLFPIPQGETTLEELRSLFPEPRKSTATANTRMTGAKNKVNREVFVGLLESGMTYEQVAKRLGFAGKSTAGRYAKLFGVARSNHNVVKGDILSDPDFWYVVGTWLAEGTVTYGRRNADNVVRFTLGYHEEEKAIFMKNVMARYNIGVRYNRVRSFPCELVPVPLREFPSINVTFSSTQIAEFVSLFGKGAEGKFLPEWAVMLPASFAHRLIDGYLEGDGYIDKTDTARISSVSISLLVGFQRLLSRLGVISQVMKCEHDDPRKRSMELRFRAYDADWMGIKKRTKRRWSSDIENGNLKASIKSIDVIDYHGFVHDIQTPCHDFVGHGMTIHNSDDLIGRILQEAEPGEWFEVNIPAIALDNDPLGRKQGESINPERLPIHALEREKKLMGPRFDSLYMGRPIDESGTLFNIDKLIEVKDVPREAHRVRAWDRAASEGKGDWTVGILMAYDNNGICYIEDIVRDRLSKDNVRARMKSTLIDDLQKYGNIEGYTFKTYFEREPAGDGMTAAEDIVRMMAPYPIYWDRPSDNKAARWAGFAVAVNAGNVKVKIAPWVRDFKDELARIVEGIDNKQDDQCDSASLAYNKLAIENAIVTVN